MAIASIKFCDVCSAEKSEGEYTSIDMSVKTVSLDVEGADKVELDLCDVHRAPVDLLREKGRPSVARRGRRPAAAAATPARGGRGTGTSRGRKAALPTPEEVSGKGK